MAGAPERLPRDETGSLPWIAGGAAAGAACLLVGGNDIFRALVPWLIFSATLLFAFAAPLHRLAAARGAGKGRWASVSNVATAFYGGYFGAGLGVILMALIILEGGAGLRSANQRKNFRAAVVTSVAVVLFVVSGEVAWREGIPAFAGAMAGGLIGGRLAAYVSAGILRLAVIATGIVLFLAYL